MMRTLATAAGALLMLTITASAGETEGQIKAIDKDQLTITLSDGKNYKLPGEFDVDSLKEGMDVVLAYDEVGGQNLITDMQLPQ
jgi:Cu/Ag efflux protein CusF